MLKNEMIALLNEIEIVSTGTNLGAIDYLKSLDIFDDKVVIVLKQFSRDQALMSAVKLEITKLLKQKLGYPSLNISYDDVVLSTISEITKLMVIASGKGGVGKSQVTVNLARQYQKQGFKVGIIDGDIYGYSIAKILDLYDTPKLRDGLALPMVKDGIEVISTQFFIKDNDNKALTWRSSMISKMFRHFFYDVAWSQDLDYIFIDMPPGTGDLYLDLPRYSNNLEMLIVTTPSLDAAHVAIRVGLMARELNIPLIGVIENMVYYLVEQTPHYIFGHGGALAVSEGLSLPLIGAIPITDDVETLDLAYFNIYENLTYF